MGCRGCLVLFAIVLLILAGLAGGVCYLATQPSSIVAGMPTVTPSKTAAVSFDNKVSRFLSDVDSTSLFGDSPIVMLEVTEEEATSKLAEIITSGQAPVGLSSPQVHFQNGRIQVSADVNVAGVTVNVGVQAQVKVRDGKPDVVVQNIDLGRVGVPDLVRQQILDAIAAGADPTKLQNLPFGIESVEIADGKLVIKGAKQSK